MVRQITAKIRVVPYEVENTAKKTYKKQWRQMPQIKNKKIRFNK